jgi:uncharacterized protein YjbI with pentapeptide repeats
MLVEAMLQRVCGQIGLTIDLGWSNLRTEYRWFTGGLSMRRKTPLFILSCVVVLVINIVATAFALRNSQIVNVQQAEKLRHVEEELRRARSDLQEERRQLASDSQACPMRTFDRLALRNGALSGPDNAFQHTTFLSADLREATLQGGKSSFQGARFDKAQLCRAQLLGGYASFQGATFVDCDLSGAKLQGAFSNVSFEHANLEGATWIGNFRGCNVNGARFAGAHLVAIDRWALDTCHFSDPPIYDTKTQFPPWFDPQQKGWVSANESGP